LITPRLEPQEVDTTSHLPPRLIPAIPGDSSRSSRRYKFFNQPSGGIVDPEADLSGITREAILNRSENGFGLTVKKGLMTGAEPPTPDVRIRNRESLSSSPMFRLGS